VLSEHLDDVPDPRLGLIAKPSQLFVQQPAQSLSEDELTKQLPQVLPRIVDKLTPNGRLPTVAELSERM